MKRKIDDVLDTWAKSKARMPLIVRGARQVGKSYSIEAFGRRMFDTFITINFEKDVQYSECFDSLKPEDILKKLDYLTRQQIVPGKTLLFFDEIELCPRALQSLRYFEEEMPELHVIAAGSLLEFILEEENFSFPVGRVSFVNMGPLSFEEFLLAIEKKMLIKEIEHATLEKAVDPLAHKLLLEHVHEYCLVGGMPKVIKHYLQTNSYLEAQRHQIALYDLYRLDFGKYSKKTQARSLQRLFDRSPELVAKHFRYSKIDPESSNPAREYKEALLKLTQARILSKMHATAANGLPLRSEVKEKQFKILFLDVGLLQASLGIDPKSELAPIHSGVLAEQFVGQELLAKADPFFEKKLYFWESSKPGSSAELDFLVNVNGEMIPIEVKAGVSGRLKSLHQFIRDRKLTLGVQVSGAPLKWNKPILSIPFYMLHQMQRIIQEMAS
jgi:predicted AAA+ superfamily ATPase